MYNRREKRRKANEQYQKPQKMQDHDLSTFQNPFTRLAEIVQKQQLFLKTKDEKQLQGEELTEYAQFLFNKIKKHRTNSPNESIAQNEMLSCKQQQDLHLTESINQKLTYDKNQCESAQSQEEINTVDYYNKNIGVQNSNMNYEKEPLITHIIQQFSPPYRDTITEQKHKFSDEAFRDYMLELYQTNAYVGHMQTGIHKIQQQLQYQEQQYKINSTKNQQNNLKVSYNKRKSLNLTQINEKDEKEQSNSEQDMNSSLSSPQQPYYGDLFIEHERATSRTKIKDCDLIKLCQVNSKIDYTSESDIVSEAEINQLFSQYEKHQIIDQNDSEYSSKSNSSSDNDYFLTVATSTVVATLGILFCRQIPELKQKSWLGIVPGLVIGVFQLIKK